MYLIIAIIDGGVNEALEHSPHDVGGQDRFYERASISSAAFSIGPLNELKY